MDRQTGRQTDTDDRKRNKLKSRENQTSVVRETLR